MSKAKAVRGRRSKNGVNKSQAVRDYMKENPSAMPREVAAALTEKGIPVTAQLVSTIKFNMANKDKIRKGRGRGRGAVAGAVSIDSLLLAKQFVDKAGGLNAARKALDTLSSLQ